MENSSELTPVSRKKGNPKLVPMTPEQREGAKLKQKEEQSWAKEHLRQDFMDEAYLRSLASEHGFKLASWWFPASVTKYISRALREVGKDSVWHKECFGFCVGEWHKYNPTYPAWVAQGLIFEQAKLGH